MEMKKLKRTATIMIAITCLVFVYTLVRITTSVLGTVYWEGVRWSPGAVIVIILGGFFLLALLALPISLLYTIKKGETPFDKKIVNRLKLLALALALYEPFNLISHYLTWSDFPVFEGYIDGELTMITMRVSQGGFVLVAGLVVYCVALIFDYGITLQNQVDETL